MIRIDDPARIGAAIGDIRAMLGIPRRVLARALAARTGRSASTWNAQLWCWEIDRSPNPASLGPVLAELGYGLALVPLDQGGPSGPTCAPQSDETASGVPAYRAGDPNASEARTEGGDWNWTPTTDGGHYSGPHGPDICPAIGCRHEGGAA